MEIYCVTFWSLSGPLGFWMWMGSGLPGDRNYKVGWCEPVAGALCFDTLNIFVNTWDNWATFRLGGGTGMRMIHADSTNYSEQMIQGGDTVLWPFFGGNTPGPTVNICRYLSMTSQDAGAMIFVCGRSHPMPSQVFDAFVEVLELNGMAKDAAANRLRAMQRSLVQR